MIPEERPTPISEFIKEDILNELNLSSDELAKALKVSIATIEDLTNDHCPLSADLALRIGKFTNTSPQMWMNLQDKLDLWDAAHSENSLEIQSISSYAA